MNIQSSPALSLPINRPIQRPVPQTLAKEAQPDDGSGTLPPTATGGPAQHQVDIATVLKHWGTSNAEGDLNVDGIVDAQDLAIAAAEQNSGSVAVQNSWGQSGVQDANGDGIVDATDLAHALHAQSTPAGSGDSGRAEVIGAIVEVAMQARDDDGDGAIM
ncbi:MAG: dockerin type I domain-containing protein, partial [bacterium]